MGTGTQALGPKRRPLPHGEEADFRFIPPVASLPSPRLIWAGGGNRGPQARVGRPSRPHPHSREDSGAVPRPR